MSLQILQTYKARIIHQVKVLILFQPANSTQKKHRSTCAMHKISSFPKPVFGSGDEVDTTVVSFYLWIAK